MSERKVLNKYYPPDFDPAKIPKLRQHRERQYVVRTMAPFNMRCNTCGDYIYQGKKFNAKTENVQDEDYIGLRIYRFYIKCPKCISEISFKTDPQNEDYAIEHGATRLFEAAKMFRKAEEQERLDKEEEEANNPMKVLENRTKDSKNEMEILENLEELREINTRKLDIDYATILRRKAEAQGEMLRKQEEEDEAYVATLFGKQDSGSIKRIKDDSDEEEGVSSWLPSFKKTPAVKRPSDVLTSDDKQQAKKSKQDSTGSKFSSKSALAGLVKVKNQSFKSNLTSTKATPADSASTKDDNTSLATQSELRNEETHTRDQTVPKPATVPTPVREPSTSSQPLATAVGPNHHDDRHQGDENCPANDVPEPDSDPKPDSDQISRSIQEGLGKKLHAGGHKAKSVGLSLLGGYAVSDDSDDSNESNS